MPKHGDYIQNLKFQSLKMKSQNITYVDKISFP